VTPSLGTPGSGRPSHTWPQSEHERVDQGQQRDNAPGPEPPRVVLSAPGHPAGPGPVRV